MAVFSRSLRPALSGLAHLTPLALVGLASLGLSCAAPAPPSSPEVVAMFRDQVPADPADPVWQEAPVHHAELLLQDLVEPRLLEPSTPRVEVASVTDGRQIAFLLRWQDEEGDDLPRPAHFSDACAVQLPVTRGPDVPAPQMGEPGRAVEITYWRASWQATVDGRPDDLAALYPDASIDHYPFEAPSLEPGSPEQQELANQYAPARALDNPMAGPRTQPVEDLLAEGPGTLTRAAEQRSSGRGERGEQGWQVVLVRPLPADLGRGDRTQVAFAIWEGGNREVGARKMRTGWIPLQVETEVER